MGHIKEVLRSSQLFEELTEGELDRITMISQEEVYEAGTTIFVEGAISNCLYIVEDGRIVLEMTIRIGPSGRLGAIDVITQGQSFGWSSVMEAGTFTMSARCLERTKVISIDAGGLWRLFEEESHIGYMVMKRLVGVASSRLRSTRDTLARILSVASHDLKAPLAAVESYHQVMLGGYAGEITEKQKNMLLRSSDRIKGLLNLIDDILDISRIDTRDLEMADTSLLKVIESSRGVIQPLAEERGIQLKVEVQQDLPLIKGAPERLQQVLNNLLGNAVKFTPEGGSVTLKVAERDGYIVVEVIDTGIGITPEELHRIFDDFYRGGRADSTGSGLGLSIARKIIEAHGGRIWAQSPCPESGKGSRLTFTLPKHLTATQGEQEEA